MYGLRGDNLHEEVGCHRARRRSAIGRICWHRLHVLLWGYEVVDGILRGQCLGLQSLAGTHSDRREVVLDLGCGLVVELELLVVWVDRRFLLRCALSEEGLGRVQSLRWFLLGRSCRFKISHWTEEG